MGRGGGFVFLYPVFFMAGMPKGILSPEGDRTPPGVESMAAPSSALLMEEARIGSLYGQHID